MLENVTVKKRYFTNDEWKFKNEAYGRRYATRYYDVDRERENALDKGEDDPYMLEYLKKKTKLFDYHREPSSSLYMYRSTYLGEYSQGATFSHTGSLTSYPDSHNYEYRFTYDGKKVQWIFDNDERRNLQTRPEELFLSDVKSIYIVPNDPSDDDGRVRIYVYLHTKFSTETKKGIRHTYWQGFNEASTFKMEDYSMLPPMADFRRTIYWNPDVITDAEGKAKVEFYNNSTCKEMYISVEGMSPEGQMLTNE